MKGTPENLPSETVTSSSWVLNFLDLDFGITFVKKICEDLDFTSLQDKILEIGREDRGMSCKNKGI